MDIKSELEQFILKELVHDQDKKSLVPDEDLLMQGYIDSLGILKLSGFIEEKFGVKVMDIDRFRKTFRLLKI